MNSGIILQDLTFLSFPVYSSHVQSDVTWYCITLPVDRQASLVIQRIFILSLQVVIQVGSSADF